MRSERRGFTLLELMVTVALMAAVAATVLPAFQDEARLELNSAANLVSSDIELAQVINITAPGQPLILRFDPGGNRYWLARPEAPLVAVPAPGRTEPYLVQLGAGRATHSAGVTMEIEGMSGDALAFSAQGGLSDLGTTPAVILRQGDRSIRVTVSPATGTVTQE
jgi:prepilin-type N-terminal cleavage/methylation domain-containing protein